MLLGKCLRVKLKVKWLQLYKAIWSMIPKSNFLQVALIDWACVKVAASTMETLKKYQKKLNITTSGTPMGKIVLLQY